MKVVFNRAALAETLGLVASVVPARTPKPVLRCVRVAADNNEVHLWATNLELGLNCVVSEAEITEPGEVVIEADRFAAVVRESADDVLTVSASDSTCEVAGADSHFTMYGQDPKQYPKVPGFEGEQADVELGLEALQEGIEQCLFATAKESSRYAINGVLWEAKGKKLLLVATDGRRLVRCRVPLTKAVDCERLQQGVIVPARTMALIQKLVGHEKDKVAVRLSDGQVLFRCAHVVISSNLVEGNFPKYEDIIPTDYDKNLTLPTEVVLSAVRRAALLTSEESKGIKLAVQPDSIVFSGSSPEAGTAEIKMPIEYGGESIEIGFNPQFLADALRVVRAAEFEMELGEADRPGVIKCGADFLYVLMPINLG